MYSPVLFLHSITRWLVLISLVTSISISIKNLRQKRLFTPTASGKRQRPFTPITSGQRQGHPFTPFANACRHWTATIAHLQLLLGMLLYFQSPVVKYPLPNDPYHLVNEHTFFRYIHITGMLIAVIVITIGSAKAKRAPTDHAKYRTMLTWFAIALLIIFLVIPWPFSPLAGRPLLRRY